MKTQVLLNEALVKLYYRDLYFKYNFFISIVVFIVGSTSAGLYISNDRIWVGISVEVVTLFVVYVLFGGNRNNAKVAINQLNCSERDYYFEFSDKEMKVTLHKDEEIFSLASLGFKKLRHMVQFKTFSKSIYIIPYKCFSPMEWETLYSNIKKNKKVR